MGGVLQSPRWQARAVALVALLIVLAAGVEFATDPEPNLRHDAILITAKATALYWGSAVLLLLIMDPRDWSMASDARYLRQLCWALGAGFLALHFAAAFHLAHDWSHPNAYRQTEATSGFGAGIFVNYAFGVIWLADAIWFAVWPDHYARRPRWLGWSVHGFLGFIVFNATVIYGVGPARLIGLFVFLSIPILAAYGWYRNRHPEPSDG